MPDEQKTAAFENVKDQMGYCGIWCGSCVVGNGALTELTRQYKYLVKAYGLDHWAPGDVDWNAFYRSLDSVAAVQVCVGCRKGGGRDDCEMRACATSKGLEECVACGDDRTCKHAGILEHMRSGAAAVGLFVKEDAADRRSLIDKWTGELRKRWPCCVLFAPAAPEPTPRHGDKR